MYVCLNLKFNETPSLNVPQYSQRKFKIWGRTFMEIAPALKLSTCHHQTYGFWLSWDPTCGSPPAASAAAPESCRTSWTPSPPPSRCPGRRRWHVGRGPRAGVWCWWACDSRPRPGTRTTRVFSAWVSRCPPPASCHPSPTACSHAWARCSSDERACLFHTTNSGGTRETVRKIPPSSQL